MRKTSVLTLLALLLTLTAAAQRTTDLLDRGLVAVPASSGGNFVSWRVFGEEYYDVTYNLYCDGSQIATGLKASCYTHTAGSAASSYQVEAVVRGKKQALSQSAKPWENGRLVIPVAAPTDRDGKDASSHYVLNDISLGDLDGDGVAEFIVKRKCDAAADVSQNKMFHQLDCYDHKGRRLWWIDLGPNMLAGADEQWDCVCYDWDRDGKAEVLLRIQDNAYIHYADGTTQLIGSANVDTRWNGVEYTSSGNEYLLYLEGATGKPYAIGPAAHPLWMDYPLTRVSDDWWGTGIVGHRSTKHYFGAPFFDGRKASIFLGRGCYTKHKFTALDVDPATHQLTQRWYWECTNGSSPWFGNGYHNFAVGDVDWDGRDEIIFGSMVIDDNGKGLSTTSYGHGDAQHCSDFDPYRKYEEQFACLEEGKANFGCNYRNAMTSQIYVKHDAGGDDGRALMANFTNDYPGSQGRSVSSPWISSVADKYISELNGDAFISWGDLNQRIYWDGDLLDEYFDSPGTEGYGAIYKPASTTAAGARWNFGESKCNNWSKNNPGAIADIFGDWREELVMRRSDNTAILVYTTPIHTQYRIPTLWHDHQYRNAMVWQSMGYNQPPHKSYFLGELEGITQAPPPLTMTGRVEVANGGTITTTDDHLIVCETNNTEINVAADASPYMVTFNVPSWAQGTAESNATTKQTPISIDYYTCTLKGGPIAGATHIVKQGEGTLTMPAGDMTYSGATDIWAGTVDFNGSAAKSDIWLNRFGQLNSNAEKAVFRSIKADYASVVRPGGTDAVGTLTAETDYYMGFGSRLVVDVYSDGMKADRIVTGKLTIEKKDWKYGPHYLQPVIEVAPHPAQGQTQLATGRYLIGHAAEVSGSVANIKIEGVGTLRTKLELTAEGDIYLVLEGVREASDIVWAGDASAVWDYANTENFLLAGDESQTHTIFVAGDNVSFTDDAQAFSVTLKDGDELPADTIRFASTKRYAVSGTGIITAGTLVKENTGTLVMGGEHAYTGGNILRGGVTQVSSLSNSTQPYGNLGAVTTDEKKFVIADGATLLTTGTVKMGSPITMSGEEGGIISNAGLFTMEKKIVGTPLTKKGSGTFVMQGSLVTSALNVEAGTFDYGSAYYRQVTLSGSGTISGAGFLTTPVHIAEGASASIWTQNRATSSNKITGSGQVTIYCATEKGTNYYATRSPMKQDLTEFTGTLVIGATNNEEMSNGATGRVFSFDTNTGAPNATFNIPEKFIVLNTGRTYRIGKLTGKGSLGGGCTFSSGQTVGANTWQVGNDESWSNSVTIIADAKWEKVGQGRITWRAANTTTGSVIVREGEISIVSATRLSTGQFTLMDGARLTGTNSATSTLNNSVYNINGTVIPGLTTISTTGAIYFGGKNVVVGKTGVVLINVGKRSGAATSTQIADIGSLTFNGTIRINPANEAGLVVGDQIKIFDAKAFTGTPKFDFRGGITWDTSRISEGILTVKDIDAAIDAVSISQQHPTRIYDLSGRLVGNANTSVKSLPKGIYLKGGKKIVIR